MDQVFLLQNASVLLVSDFQHPLLPVSVAKQAYALYLASSFLLLSSSAAINGIAGAAGKQTIANVIKPSRCIFAVITTDVED